MCYRRFTLPLRYQLQALHQAQHPICAIAKQLGFHRTTIRRELARVCPYDAELAHDHAHDGQERRHRPRILECVWHSINEQLKLFHSPEQIVGRHQFEGQGCPSVERIYQDIYAHPKLAQYLRRGRSARRCRSSRRHAPLMWTSITQRSEAANTRQETLPSGG